jgi:biopolymer transport protein ExbD
MAIGRQLMGVTSEPNVVPMADVMLVLLIIFMVITPMLQKDVSVDLVRTNNPREMPDADKEDAVVVSVTRDGNVFLGSTQTAVEELSAKVQELVATRIDKTVYIKSDSRAKYERVVTVIDEVRSAGVDQLGLLTEEIE